MTMVSASNSWTKMGLDQLSSPKGQFQSHETVLLRLLRPKGILIGQEVQMRLLSGALFEAYTCNALTCRLQEVPNHVPVFITFLIDGDD